MIIDFFERFEPLPGLIREQLEARWSKAIELKRGEMLLCVGQRERHLYYIEKGALNLFFPDDQGQEITVGFGYTDSFVTSPPSFLRDQPSKFGMTAIRKTKLLAISKEAFYELRAASPAIERVWQWFLEEALIGLIERESAMLIADPRVRLQKLLDRSPHIFQHIPQKYIASYLRMSPETLSRIYK